MKLCRIVYNISLYKNIGFYCHCLSTLVAMATLNFILERCVERSSIKHIFVQTSQSDWLSWKPKGSICETY